MTSFWVRLMFVCKAGGAPYSAGYVGYYLTCKPQTKPTKLAYLFKKARVFVAHKFLGVGLMFACKARGASYSAGEVG